MPEDIYDLLTILVQHAGRSGLAEHLVHAGHQLIERFDPKVADKRAAAAAAAAKAEQDYRDFEAFKAFQAAQAAGQAAPAAAPVASSAAAPPVVTG